MEIIKPKDKLNKYYINYLFHWIKKDIVVIIICLLVLATCFVTLASMDAYKKQIDEAWMQQWIDLGCIEKTPLQPHPINITYKFWGDYK